MQYRQEIDGLRALAVLPVIFFHAGISGFSGGFIGVDIFFVISGFLITTLIIEDLEKKRFSFSEFYERRARRILPALTLIVVITIGIGWLCLPYGDLKQLGKSSIYIGAFSSNFYFWKETGYFETSSELQPLLHTWSLSVEEQYYVIVPVLLLILHTHSRKIQILVLGCLTIFSLALAQIGITHFPSGAFFLLPTRAWELAIGGIAAISTQRRIHNGREANVLSLLGLAMLTVPIFFYDKNTPLPGLYALVPVLGTVLILIYARVGTVSQKLLRHPILVGVGLISYSAYLWHQPLLAFVRHLTVGELSLLTKFSLILITLLLAWLTWRYVERPFRNRENFNSREVFGWSIIALTLCILLGYFSAYSKNAKERMALSGRSFTSLSNALYPNRGLDDHACMGFTTSSLCKNGKNPIAVLWGDSFAMHLALALKSSKTPLPFVQMTKSACRPILGTALLSANTSDEEGKACITHNNLVYEWLVEHPEIRLVILSSPFSETLKDSKQILPNGSHFHASGNDIYEQLIKTIKRIHALGRSVVIVSPTPSPPYDVGRCLVTQNVLGMSLKKCDFVLSEKMITVENQLEKIKKFNDVSIFSISEVLCPNKNCYSQLNEAFIYRDKRGHISREGAIELGKTYDISGLLLKSLEQQNMN